MFAVLNRAQMQACDKKTIEEYGVPSCVLMEKASLAVADAVENYSDAVAPDRIGNDELSVLSICGTGNNGGDGLASARILSQRGYDVSVCFPGNKDKMTDECRRQFEICEKYEIPIYTKLPEDYKYYDVILDGLIGIQLTRPLKGAFYELISAVNETDAYKIAIDIPTGIDADTGQVLGTAFCADETVTFGFVKAGQLLYPGKIYCGGLSLDDIGMRYLSLNDPPYAISLEMADVQAMLPARNPGANKGTYGKIVIFAGSRNMAGAAVLCAKSAYACGAGLVMVVTDECNREIIQTSVPEAILRTYNDKTDILELVKDAAAWCDVAAVGPGIGRTYVAEELTKCVINEIKDKPCVIDADALNIIAEKGIELSADFGDDLCANFVITPHVGEASRLLGVGTNEIKADLIGAARSLSKGNAIAVLKDAGTVTFVKYSNGLERTYINNSGNDGMATAGSGDVLTGVIAALLARGVCCDVAAPFGVFLHGLGGDAAAEECGAVSMCASDIINGIKRVIKNAE